MCPGRTQPSLRDCKCISNTHPALKCRAIGNRRYAAFPTQDAAFPDKDDAPQGLKPPSQADPVGTAEAVPLPVEIFAASFISQVTDPLFAAMPGW